MELPPDYSPNKHALEVFLKLRKQLLADHPELPPPIYYMVACMMEEAGMLMLEASEYNVDVIIEAGQALAPKLIEEAALQESLEAGEFFMEGNDQIH